MGSTSALRNATEETPVVAIIGGAVAGSEAALACAKHGALAVVFEQGVRPYGKIEDGLPRWHEKLRHKEYARIDQNLDRDGILFVPNTRVGEDLPWETVYEELGFTAVVLANGAWRDRPLPVEGIEAFEGRGLVYQNPFVYWFNHYEESSYDGPSFEVVDDTIVVGGGLASIDVVKIVNLELYRRALRQRGIEVDLVEMELKGIPRTLEAHGIEPDELGVRGCTLYYRRGKEDMPLASADRPTEKELEKLRSARTKLMDRVMRKYLVKFEPLCRPVAPIAEGSQLAGLRFQRTEVVGGRVRDVEGSQFDVRGNMVISSIGSVPRPISGVPTEGELYAFSDWETGELRELPGAFGLGNVLTGKGNIKDSRANAIDVAEHSVCAYLGVGEEPTEVPGTAAIEAERTAARAVQGSPMSVEQMHALADRLDERHRAIGFTDYASWIAAHPPA